MPTYRELQRAIQKNYRLASGDGIPDVAPGVPGGTHIPTVTYGTAAPNPIVGLEGDVYLESNDGVVLKTHQKDIASGTWLDIGDVNPAWTSFNPTVTSGTGTITSFVSKTVRYRLIGKICLANFNVWINAAGTGGGSIRIQLPVEPIAALGACASVFSNAAGGVGGCGFVEPTAVSLLGYPDVRVLKYDGTTLIGASVQTVGSILYETI